MSDSLPRRSSSPKVPGAERSATMQTALEALLSGSSADPVRRALGLAAPELIDAARSVGLDVREVVIRPTREPLHLPAAAGQRASATPGHGGRSAATQEAFHAALAALAEPAAGGESGR